MLPNSPDVETVALGPDGIIEGAHPGLIFVDMSSIARWSPALEDWQNRASRSRRSRQWRGAQGHRRHPVGHGGGDRAVFDQVKDVLVEMAASVVFVGEIGAGNIAKLATRLSSH